MTVEAPLRDELTLGEQVGTQKGPLPPQMISFTPRNHKGQTPRHIEGQETVLVSNSQAAKTKQI